MSVLKDWLLALTAAALALSLAQAVTPEGTIKKIGALVGGMVLLLVLARPILGLDPQALTDLAGTYTPQMGENLTQGEQMMKTLIAEKTSAYIVDKGAALGFSCKARVEVREDENGWPVPWETWLSGDWSPEQLARLSEAIQAELDIPAARQHFGEVAP